MALNPNIILSGMPQPFDTNALLQQQISGMENINVLERQRRADELAMQDRAAAAEKEAAQAQEAATLKALLPAYTYGIQTGDMAGALNLVPPEMQESLRPYADALVGKSPQEVQAALIGSLSSSPAGQEALAAIQRAQTAQIQLGQLDVSRGRLAFDTEQAAAAAARPPKGNYERFETDEGIFILNRDTGEIAPATLSPAEGPISAEVPPQAGPLKPAKKETAEEVKKRLADEKRAKDLTMAITEVETVMQPGNLIDQSTGSYIGNLIDGTLATVGWGTPGYEANAKLAPIADLVLKMVPRFEGPQSNYDVQSYKDAAGNLADPTVPNSVKKAAAKEIVRLFKKYRDQFEYAPDGAGAEEAPGGPRQISTDEEYDALPSGTEFLDPDGVLRRKP